MELRTATEKDIPALKAMFKNIVRDMYQNGVVIWNDFYPFEEFAGDVRNNNLFLIAQHGEIAAAFCVCDAAAGQDCFDWKDKRSKAAYLFRVGVNVSFQRQGVGKQILENAFGIARQRGAKYLRLLVADVNRPALNFYQKNGFVQVAGTYTEFSEALGKDIVEMGLEREADVYS